MYLGHSVSVPVTKKRYISFMYLLILSVKLIRCIPKCGEETGNLLLDSNNCFITSSSLEPPILCSGCISYKSAFDVICSCCQATWYIH